MSPPRGEPSEDQPGRNPNALFIIISPRVHLAFWGKAIGAEEQIDLLAIGVGYIAFDIVVAEVARQFGS
jgi:hypothetical protein